MTGTDLAGTAVATLYFRRMSHGLAAAERLCVGFGSRAHACCGNVSMPEVKTTAAELRQVGYSGHVCNHIDGMNPLYEAIVTSKRERSPSSAFRNSVHLSPYTKVAGLLYVGTRR